MNNLLPGMHTRVSSSRTGQGYRFLGNRFNRFAQEVLNGAAVRLGLPAFEVMAIVTQAKGHSVHLIQGCQKRFGFSNLVHIALFKDFV